MNHSQNRKRRISGFSSRQYEQKRSRNTHGHRPMHSYGGQTVNLNVVIPPSIPPTFNFHQPTNYNMPPPSFMIPPPYFHIPPPYFSMPPPTVNLAPHTIYDTSYPPPVYQHFPQTVPNAGVVLPTAPIPGIDVGDLFQQLLASGLISNGTDDSTSSENALSQQSKGWNVEAPFEHQPVPYQTALELQPVPDQTASELQPVPDQTALEHQPVPDQTAFELLPVPDLTVFDTSSLRERYNGVIGALHQGIPCTTCGRRFQADELHGTVYREHLDWHFAENKRAKEGGADTRTRGWYYDVMDWIQYETVKERDAAEALVKVENACGEGGPKDPAAPLASMGARFEECPTASGGGVQGDSCAVCLEAFVQFWDDDADEWRLKDAVRYLGAGEGEEEEEGLVGGNYHRVCFEDASKQDYTF